MIFVHYFEYFGRSYTMNILKPHLSLNITNIDASVAFYEKAFGVAATKRRPGYAKFDLAEPSLNLTLQEAPRTGVNASHFGIQVASSEDVAAAWTRFKAAGLATKTEDNTECCYALQDKVWVEDPDGNAWEVFVVKGEGATMGRAASPAGCCAPGVKPSETDAGASGRCCG
jgi:catechol 2,3-dioxygenase-like lactoylglutathione lyase family enzyme